VKFLLGLLLSSRERFMVEYLEFLREGGNIPIEEEYR
jgi:hypothetical protein